MSIPIPRASTRFVAGAAALLASLALACGPPDPGAIGPAEIRHDATEWRHYGGSVRGDRYAELLQITPENVSQLEVVWTYHTGDVSDGRGDIASTTAFEVTPILVHGVLYFCTPFNRVIALDPETGAEHWAYDPEIDLTRHYANQLVCRGVAYWDGLPDPASISSERRRRVRAERSARQRARRRATDRIWRESEGIPAPDAVAEGVREEIEQEMGRLAAKRLAKQKADTVTDGTACQRRIFTATNEAILIALDAATGLPCQDFGEGGRLDLNEGSGEQRWKGEYQVTSPPLIAENLVIVGSAVSDNARTDAPSGVVRAFDVETGELRWAWDLRPPDFDPTFENTTRHGYAKGTPNVWAPMSYDEERGLVVVPTGNPAPDYWRGDDLVSMDHYGSSVVGLDIENGDIAWHYQTVHHDLWDFDVPAQPTLVHIQQGHSSVPVVIQATKMGFLFVLDRNTGAPIFEVDEDPVNTLGAPGELISPTQPYPLSPPPLVRQQIGPDDAWGLTPWDRNWCRKRIESLRFFGPFTPPSLEGTLMYPGNAGGANWGGIAFDPDRMTVIANVMDIPWVVTLIERDEYERERAENPDVEIAPQDGTPYAMRRELLLSPLGLPCVKPPWGKLVAIEMLDGNILWEKPFGTPRDLLPFPVPFDFPWEPGVPNIGGPLLTESGLLFIGAAVDDYLRAYDTDTGDELWKARLPAGGQATPMTYQSGGRQYVVIAAGGHARAQTTLGDSIVAFALPDSALPDPAELDEPADDADDE